MLSYFFPNSGHLMMPWADELLFVVVDAKSVILLSFSGQNQRTQF